jgi:hypothetical protein
MRVSVADICADWDARDVARVYLQAKLRELVGRPRLEVRFINEGRITFFYVCSFSGSTPAKVITARFIVSSGRIFYRVDYTKVAGTRKTFCETLEVDLAELARRLAWEIQTDENN